MTQDIKTPKDWWAVIEENKEDLHQLVCDFHPACRHVKLVSLLNQTWFGIPESSEVRRITGFFPLCDLCSESWVFEDKA